MDGHSARGIGRVGMILLLLATCGCSGRLVEPLRPVPVEGPLGPAKAPPPAQTGDLGAVPQVSASSVFPAEGRETPARYHTVAAGETLSTIARQYQLSLGRLQQENGLDADATIVPGQILYLPQ